MSTCEQTPTGKRRRCIIADLAGTFTAGGTTNKILASAFGLTKIESCGMGVLDDNSAAYFLVPSYDGTLLCAIALTQATDANRSDVADITVTSPRKLRVEVHGY
jgi:hypothetical protein